MPRDVDVVWVRGGDANAEPVILPREAINFCMSPLGARGLVRDEVPVLARLLVDRLLESPLVNAGEGVKLGIGEDGLRGDRLRFGVDEGVLKLLSREGAGRVRGLSFWLWSVKSDMRVTLASTVSSDIVRIFPASLSSISFMLVS